MSFLKDFKDLKKDISMSIDENENLQQQISQESGMEQTADGYGSYDTDRDEAGTESDEASVIAKGTSIEGNLTSDGSIAVYGVVHGDIQCAKKLIVTGKVEGNLTAGEIFINKASIDGEVVSEGNLKIGNNSVILGNVFGKTAVIAGAVKGEIDIHGPVIIDNTAVIKGNIKSASVQINNGAVIEGYCTQCYHDVDVNAIFDDTFPREMHPAQTAPQTQAVPALEKEYMDELLFMDSPVTSAGGMTGATETEPVYVPQEPAPNQNETQE